MGNYLSPLSPNNNNNNGIDGTLDGVDGKTYIERTSTLVETSILTNKNYSTNENIYADEKFNALQLNSGINVFNTPIAWTNINIYNILLGGGGSYNDPNGGHGLFNNAGVENLSISKNAGLLGGGGGAEGGAGGPGGGGGGGKGITETKTYGQGGYILKWNNNSMNNGFIYNEGIYYDGPGGGGPGGGEGAQINQSNVGGYGGSYNTDTGLYKGTDGGAGLNGWSGGGGGYGGGDGGRKGTGITGGGGGGGGGEGGGDGGGNGGYGIKNSGTIYHLKNYQGGNNRYGPLFYCGTLPEVYTIYVDTINNYGQIYLTGVENKTTRPNFVNTIYVTLNSLFTTTAYNRFPAVIVGYFTNPPTSSSVTSVTNYVWRIIRQPNNATFSTVNYGVYDLEIYIKLSQPRNLSYTPGNQSISFSFTKSSNDNKDNGIYYYSIDNGASKPLITGTSGTITNLDNNASYTLIIYPYNQFGYGESSTITVKTFKNPGKPTITNINVGNGNITIYYNVGEDSGADSITENYLRYTTNKIDYTETYLGAGTPNNFSSLTGGNAYFFQLRSKNNANLYSEYSDFYPSSGIALKVYIPSSPTIELTDGNNQSVLTITPPISNGGYDITEYAFKKNSESYTTLYGTTTTIQSLTNGDTYTVYVRVSNAAGSVEAYKDITLTPNPSAPTINYNLSSVGNASVTIYYSTDTNGGQDILTNYINYKTSSTSYSDNINILNSGSYTVNGLTPYIIYTFRLISQNNKLAYSSYSNELTTTPILNTQNVSIIPTKNYFLYNDKSLDTIFALDTSFNGTTTTNYKMNGIDIGKRYLSGTYATNTNYKTNNTDLNASFTTTSITYTSNILLPVDRLSITTKNAILPDMTIPDVNILTVAPTNEASISAGVYGCKLLFSSYTGPVMTLRRGNDNRTAHFYANSDGTLGSEYLGTGISLSIWLPTGVTAYVQIWWDQTGNGNHAYQFNSDNQPTYNSSNKYIEFPLVTNSPLVATYFNLRNGVHPWGNSNYTYVFKCSISHTNGGIFGGGQASYNNVNAFRRDTNEYQNYWYLVDITTTGSSYADNSVISLVYNGSNRYIYKNNTMIRSGSASSRNQTKYNNTIGKSLNDEYMKGGYIQYMYIIPIAISDTDRQILQNT